MRTLFVAVLCALCSIASAPAVAQEPAATGVPGGVVRETELDRQVKAVSAQLRCVVCQGLSLADSPSELAQDMRAIVREQLEAGKTPAEVKAYFVERYGEWVLLQPEPRGFNLVVYIAPILLLVGGAAFVYFKARSLTRVPVENV
ncbi:MAG TPA: cytochrome c-type biogenesis protein [Longimicrobiales bacterium]|nr:cytochrome c-type biogenesis protein [Longimicrobiales bacterium]